MKSFILLVIFVLTLGLCLPASASLTKSYTFSQPTTTWLWGNNVEFPQFNPADGQLEKVTIDLSCSGAGWAGMENESDSIGQAKIDNASIDIFVKKGNVELLSLQPFTGSSPMTIVYPYDGTTDFGGTSGFKTADLSGTATGSLQYTAPADLGAYTGTGTITFWFANNEHLTVGSSLYSPMPLSTFQHSSSGDMTITYTYTPEPATVALLAMGGVAMIRRKRR